MREPVVIGTAELVGTFKQDSPEWHQARAEVIGASEVASVLGLSPYKSAFRLWHEKKGLLPPEEPSPQMRRKLAYGHYMEPFIAELFTTAHPAWITQTTGSWRNVDRIWQGCNPDRLIYPADSPSEEIPCSSLLEIKTFPYAEDWRDGPPPGYVAQVRWQLDTFGFQRGWLAGYANVSGDYFEYQIEADPFEADAVRARVLAFVQSLTEDTPPEIDGSESTYQALRQLNPSLVRGSEVIIPDDVAEQYLDSIKFVKAATADNTKWKGHLLAHMGTAQYANYNGQKIASRVGLRDSVPYLKEA